MKYRIIATLVILAVLIAVAIVGKPVLFPESDTVTQPTPAKNVNNSFSF